MKRGILMGDMHHGGITGLTPPKWHDWVNSEKAERTKAYRIAMWMEYVKIISRIGPVDFVLTNGDATDGLQGRQGKHDVIGEGFQDQVQMGIHTLRIIPGDPDHYMTTGTEYHVTTADGEDVELEIAKALKGRGPEGQALIDDRLFFEIEGVLFDARHFIGASSIQHLRHTALAKENAINCQWKIDGTFERIPDVIVRSHVHYYVKDAGVNGVDQEWTGVVLPSLQGLGGKFGMKKCSSVVHFGLVEVVVHNGRLTECKPHLVIVPGARPKIHSG